jgi:hypothetical protein
MINFKEYIHVEDHFCINNSKGDYYAHIQNDESC